MTHPQAKRTSKILLRGSTALLTFALATAMTVTSGIVPEAVAQPAQAQSVSLSVQFRTALEPHGRWQQHSRWGEVWIPAKRDRDWRPYTVGRWTYTDRWGWYWVSDEDFGWVTYHYGRWVLDQRFGWVWLPGNEWGPAWVQWRRGDRHAGWAPLPPREVIYEYDDNPDFWIFVSFNNFTAPNIRRVIVPPRERTIYIRETVIVNRTIIIDRDGGDRRARFAVNPGIEPRIVAARVGKPIPVATVKPVVVAGTVGVESAVEVRAEEASKRRERVRAEVTESKETVEPAKDVPPPQALNKDEEGRLGERPPEAAKGGKPVPAAQAEDRSRGDDGAKGGAEDAAKAKDAAAAKSRAEDDDKAKPQDAAKAKETDEAEAKSKDAARANSQADDAKSKARDDAAARAKASAREEGEAKAQSESRSKGEARQAAPKQTPEPQQESRAKSAPEPKQESRARAEPKSVPEPRQAAPKPAPEPKQETRERPQPEPKQAGPRAESQRKQPSPPKEAAPGPRQDEKKKEEEG